MKLEKYVDEGLPKRRRMQEVNIEWSLAIREFYFIYFFRAYVVFLIFAVILVIFILHKRQSIIFEKKKHSTFLSTKNNIRKKFQKEIRFFKGWYHHLQLFKIHCRIKASSTRFYSIQFRAILVYLTSHFPVDYFQLSAFLHTFRVYVYYFDNSTYILKK